MSTTVKNISVAGLILTILGSLLPWRVEGDFLYFRTFGIRIFPSIEDNGGLSILLLSIALAVLVFHPPTFIKQPAVWSVVFSITITFDSAFHIINLVLDRSNEAGIIGAPVIQIGLIMVFVGSVILLVTSLLQHKKISQ